MKKPNYRQDRVQRERVKEERKQEKLKRREEDTAKRKALRKSSPSEDEQNK